METLAIYVFSIHWWTPIVKNFATTAVAKDDYATTDIQLIVALSINFVLAVAASALQMTTGWL